MIFYQVDALRRPDIWVNREKCWQIDFLPMWIGRPIEYNFSGLGGGAEGAGLCNLIIQV